MKLSRFALLGVFCGALLAGCARTAPIHNVNQPITAHVSEEQVKKAIVQAGLERGWAMTPTTPGVIQGRITARGHSAEIKVNYSATRYDITYVSSQNLLSNGKEIHNNYNRWVNNLDKDIQIKLATANM